MFRLQLTLAARYLWGRKLRSFLTTLAIVFGTLVIFGTNMLLPTMLRAFQSNLMAASGQVDLTLTHKTGEAFSRSLINRLTPIAGIRAAAGSLSRTVNIPESFYGKKTQVSALTLTGIDPRTQANLRSYPVTEGRFLRSTDDAVAVITTSLAQTLGLKLGEKLYLPTTEGTATLKIVGILPARALPGNEEVLVTLLEAQKLLDLSGRINTIEMNLDTTDPARRAAIEQQIQAAVGGDYTLGGLSSESDLFASIKTGQMAMNLFGFLSMFMGGFIIFNTFRTVVAERRHDIGMLRAIGAGRATIIGMILTEGILQGVVGTAVGIALGYLMGASVLSGMRPMMVQFLHVSIGAPVVDPWLIGMTVGFGVGITVLAGLLPALSASRVTPLAALRPPVAEVSNRTAKAGAVIGFAMVGLALLGLFSGSPALTGLGGLLLLVGLVLAGPTLVRPITAAFSGLITLLIAREGTGTLAQNNLNRQPTRAAITASATMIGLAIIVGLGGMVWSLTGGFLGVLQRSLGSDYLIMPPAVGVWQSDLGAKQDLAAKLRDVPGVGVVSTMRFALSSVNGQSVSLLGIDPVTYPQVGSLTFQQGSDRTAYADLGRERGLIANGVLAATLGLKPGDLIQLSTPTGLKNYRIVAVAGDYLNAKIMTAYIAQTYLQADFRKSEDILYQLNLKPGADPAQVEPRLNALLADYAQFKLVSGKSYFEENKRLFDAVFAVYFVLLAVMAVPSLIAMVNTLSIAVIERTREIGMLRAIGATRKQVRRMVLAESLLLAAIGTAFGLAAGLYLGYVMVLGLGSSGYPVAYVFPTVGLAAAVAAGLIFGILAAALPSRQATGMAIVRALRYE